MPQIDPEIGITGLLDVPVSRRGFNLDLYREHVEEGGFLYEQSRYLRDDPEIGWFEVEDFEIRLEAHIDALVVGGELALRVCEHQVRESDFGALYVAVCVYCRRQRRDLVLAVLDGLDEEDEERLMAVADALCHDVPPAWEPDVIGWIDQEGPRGRIGTRVVGYRRLQVGPQLAAGLPARRGEQLCEAIRTLGRLRYTPARVPLYERYLQQGDESVSSAAALALLRIGEPQALHFCTALARTHPWTALPLGLGGSQADAKRLLPLASFSSASPEVLYALGLLGDPAAIEVLLEALGTPARGEAAATALNLITGAGLYETVVVPDEVAEDELFEDERERLEQGEPLIAPGDEPSGRTMVQLSTRQEAWVAWWQQNQGRFKPGVRYRNGTAYSLACLLDNLSSRLSPTQVRRWALEELTIRYGCEVVLETEQPVARQYVAIRQCTAWVNEHSRHFREGKWYFAGHLVT